MSIRRNSAMTVTFEAIDPLYRPARKSGLTIANTSCWISKDGSNFVNTTNGSTELTGVTGRYKIVLTASEMDASWVHLVVETVGMDPVGLTLGTHGSPSGVVVADAGNSSTVFKTDRTEATDDYWKDALVLFTSGSLSGQVKKVTVYTGSSKVVTTGAFTGTPAASDRFILINI